MENSSKKNSGIPDSKRIYNGRYEVLKGLKKKFDIMKAQDKGYSR